MTHFWKQSRPTRELWAWVGNHCLGTKFENHWCRRDNYGDNSWGGLFTAERTGPHFPHGMYIGWCEKRSKRKDSHSSQERGSALVSQSSSRLWRDGRGKASLSKIMKNQQHWLALSSVISTESSSSCFIRAVSYYCLYSDNKVHLDREVHQL